MRNTSLLIGMGLVGLVACGGGASEQPLKPAAPMSADDHIEMAQSHEELAVAHQRAADEAATQSTAGSYDCGDTVLTDQATSGGERLVNMLPCFNVTDESRGASARARVERSAKRRPTTSPPRIACWAAETQSRARRDRAARARPQRVRSPARHRIGLAHHRERQARGRGRALQAGPSAQRRPAAQLDRVSRGAIRSGRQRPGDDAV